MQHLIPILTLGVFGIINTEMGVAGIIPQIAQHFGVSVSKAGLTVSVFAMAVAVSAPIMPLLLSGFNRKKLMLWCLFLFALSPIIACFAPNFEVMLISRALPAFFHPVYVAMAFTLASQSSQEPSRGVAKIFVGVSSGMVLGVPITSFIAVNLSYEAAMLSFALVNALVLVLTWILFPSLSAEKKHGLGDFKIILRPIVIISVLSFTFINGAMFGFFSFMSDFLHEVSALDFNAIGLVLLGYGIANIAGNIIGGALFPGHRLFYVFLLPSLMLVSYLALYLCGAQALLAVILIIALGVMAGFVNIPGQHLIASAAYDAPDFANGLFLTAANLGTTLGTALCGLFISLYQSHQSLYGTVIFLVCALLSLCVRTMMLKGSAGFVLKKAL